MTHVIPFHPLNTRFITFVVSILKYSPSKFKNSLFFFNVTFDHCTVHLFFFFLLSVLKFCKKDLVYKIRNSSICKYFVCGGICKAFKPFQKTKQTIVYCLFFSDVRLSQFSHNNIFLDQLIKGRPLFTSARMFLN